MARRGAFWAAACCGAAISAAAPVAHAEFVVLRSGQRLHVTSYQLVGDTYRLQLEGGSAEIAASEVTGIEPEEVFTAQRPAAAVPRIGDAKMPFRELMEQAAGRYGVDADLIASVIAVESQFNPKAISRRSARGLMQLMPQTAARLGVQNIFDPRENIDAGTRYLRDLLARYNNDLVLTLAAYNAGPDKVEQYGHVVPPYRETVSYVWRVKRAYDKAKSTTRKTATTTSASTTDAAAKEGTAVAASGGL